MKIYKVRGNLTHRQVEPQGLCRSGRKLIRPSVRFDEFLCRLSSYRTVEKTPASGVTSITLYWEEKNNYDADRKNCS
jgi:hypothetical protein